MCAKSTFTILGEDVLRIIVCLIQTESPSSLPKLALVSKFCKELVDPSLFRSIELSYDDKNLASTKQKTHKLLDPSYNLSRHVRDLSITGFKGDYAKSSATELENVIGGLIRLQSFNWGANANIPESVILILEKQWPNAKLIVSNHDRRHTDTRLLSSTLLHALTFGINNWKNRHEAQEQHSKLPQLRDILLNNPKIKKLEIRTKYSWTQRQATWPEYQTTPHIMNLPLLPTDRLPPLDELRLSGPDTYELDLRHCQLLKQCMDWSQLQSLDLSLSCPQHFFEEIGDRLASLKRLTMGIRTGDRRYEYWKYGPMTCQDLRPVTKFLKSVPGLQELHCADLDAAAETVVPAILKSQKSLRKFSYHVSMYRKYNRRKLPYTWTTTQLDNLRQQSPDLWCLEIDFPLDDGKWPSRHANTLARFNRLKTLKVFVELNEDASDFSAAYHQDVSGSVSTPRFNEKLGREVATKLFRNFFLNDAYSRLTDLEVCFTRAETYDRAQTSDIQFPIFIRRMERDDAPDPVDGGFTVDCLGKWLGRWY